MIKVLKNYIIKYFFSNGKNVNKTIFSLVCKFYHIIKLFENLIKIDKCIIFLNTSSKKK